MILTTISIVAAVISSFTTLFSSYVICRNHSLALESVIGTIISVSTELVISISVVSIPAIIISIAVSIIAAIPTEIVAFSTISAIVVALSSFRRLTFLISGVCKDITLYNRASDLLLWTICGLVLTFRCFCLNRLLWCLVLSHWLLSYILSSLANWAHCTLSNRTWTDYAVLFLTRSTIFATISIASAIITLFISAITVRLLLSVSRSSSLFAVLGIENCCDT